MIETAQTLKGKGANRIYLIATFALFTDGTSIFDEAYQKGIFTKLYTTNLSYVPENIKKKEWYFDTDCSLMLAEIIDKLNKKESIEEFSNGRGKVLARIKEKKDGK